MGTKLGSMTIGSLFKKPETIQYPAQTRFVPKGLKGHIRIEIEDCIMCGICQKQCPADAITVVKDESTWTIDRFRCVQCNSCVYACPQDCLFMEPTYTPVNTDMGVEVFKQQEESEEEKAAKEAKEAEKAARIKAALEAKAAREKEQSKE